MLFFPLPVVLRFTPGCEGDEDEDDADADADDADEDEDAAVCLPRAPRGETEVHHWPRRR